MGTTDATPAVLDELDAGERSVVLDRLLADHPDLRPEAEALARETLDDVDEDAVAHEVVEIYRDIEIQRIGERVGPRRGRGYIDEHEAAWELLEEALQPFLGQIARRARSGFTDAARRYAAGVLSGLGKLRADADPDSVFGWGPPEEAADSLGWSVRHAAEEVGVPLPDPSPGTEY
ncbi:MAG: hypothetical protein KY460_01875 [Actinobacteria bacterium]|nr:hypothetical protein [Actinomycetota bacterium]